MAQEIIHHFGSPFIDTIIESNDHLLNGASAVKANFKSRLGGICNTIDLALDMDVTVHLIVSEDKKNQIESQIKNTTNIVIHYNKEHQHIHAFIIDNTKKNQRKSFVSKCKMRCLYLNTKIIKSGKAIFSYIEDFPVRIDSLCDKNVIVFTDFNNSISIQDQSSEYHELLKNNLFRTNFFLFSDDELEEVEDFINQINPLFGRLEDLQKISFISHEPKSVSFYSPDFVNNRIKLTCFKTILNDNYLESIATSVGNGDLFLLLFSCYYSNSVPIEEQIKRIMIEISRKIAVK